MFESSIDLISPSNHEKTRFDIENLKRDVIDTEHYYSEWIASVRSCD